MAELKTQPTNKRLEKFLNAIEDDVKRKDVDYEVLSTLIRESVKTMKLE